VCQFGTQILCAEHFGVLFLYVTPAVKGEVVVCGNQIRRPANAFLSSLASFFKIVLLAPEIDNGWENV